MNTARADKKAPAMDRVSGREIGLPVVEELGFVRSHVAQLVNWHAHRGPQLLLLLRGTSSYEFRGGGPAEIALAGGHFLVVPAGMAHRAAPDLRPPCILFQIVLDGRTRADRRHTSFTRREWNWLTQQLRQPHPTVHAFSEELHRVVRPLTRDLEAFRSEAGSPFHSARLRVRVCKVLLEAAGQMKESTRSIEDKVVRAVADYFQGHLAEKIVMASVAASLNMTRTRMFELFRRGKGITPNDYLMRARVAKARELLRDPRMSVTDVAFTTGFGSSQYFCTVFRKYTGTAPGEFRRTPVGKPPV